VGAAVDEMMLWLCRWPPHCVRWIAASMALSSRTVNPGRWASRRVRWVYGDRLSLDAINGPDDGCSRKVISRNVIDERGDGCFRWTWRWLQRRMPRWYDYVGDVLVGNAESLCPSLVARSPSCSP